jgi:hypothetical protein
MPKPFPLPSLRAARSLMRAALLAVVLLVPGRLSAQVRERPVPFDSAGRVSAITPPLAARLALSAPVWPVTGDYLEARLFAIGEAGDSYVVVVRRQRDAVDRYPLTGAQREALMLAVQRGNGAMLGMGSPDSTPTFISEPVRGQFVANQTALGSTLFGIPAALLTDDPAVGGAVYLLVAGGTFFYSAAITQTTPVTRAQNHLSTYGAFSGAIGSYLGLVALGGGNLDAKAYVAAVLFGGIAGDVIGFQMARPMTDAEAHGTSHGSTVTGLLTAGLLGSVGAYENDGTGRLAAAAIVAAGAAGYPLGLRYVRTAPYRVTAGDVGAMTTSELLGVGVAATLMPDSPSSAAASAVLTAGYAAGAIIGDRYFVRRFDHTESDARLLGLGTSAGALMGLAIPSLSQSSSDRVRLGFATVGGILGAMITESIISPPRANPGDHNDRRTGALPTKPASRVDLRFNPQALVMAGTGVKGSHSLVTIGF